MDKVLRNKRAILLLTLPGVLLMFAGIVFPILMSVWLSFTNMQGVGSTAFVGLANYVKIFTRDRAFWVSILHALTLGLCLVLIQHPVCIAFALLLDKMGGRGEKLFRVLFFIPCVISVMVTSKMWVNIFNPTFGLLNKVLGAVGLSSLAHNWLSDPHTVLGCVIFVVMWQGFGNGMLIYYAGVKGLSQDVSEACLIDGATGFRKLFRITLPMLMPVIVVNVTLAVISALKQMETIFLMTDGGPGNSSQFIANYLYQQAFRNYRYGYANAISVVFVVICLLATLVYNRVMSMQDD